MYTNMKYSELVAEATARGFEKANQTKRDVLVEFLTSASEKKSRVRKPVDSRIFELADGTRTCRQIAAELGVKYSDIYFALKKANLKAKPVKKAKA